MTTTTPQSDIKSGVRHWKEQRASALLLIPLGLWLVVSLAYLASTRATYDGVHAWVGDTLNGILLIVFCGALFRHLLLGLEVVVDDYVHTPRTNRNLHKFIRLLGRVCAAVAIISVIVIMIDS